MKVFVRKAKSFLSRLFRDFNCDRVFSLRFALLRLGETLFGRFGLNGISTRLWEKRNNWIYTYLKECLSGVIAKYENVSDEGEKTEAMPIWVCWWTGLDTAPALVRKCINSINNNSGSHPVHVLTKDNVGEYIDIPHFMLQKVNDGQMGLAHLADYIRVKLLATYGGLWLDATMFCSDTVPDMCFELPVFTCKGPVRKCRYISEYRWVTFCLGGWKGNVIYRYLADALKTYWLNNSGAVDYLFFDQLILLGYNSIPAVKHFLDAIPENNVHRDDLQAAMNAALPANAWDSVIKSETTLYKLSWRETYNECTSSGEESIYSHYVKDV